MCISARRKIHIEPKFPWRCSFLTVSLGSRDTISPTFQKLPRPVKRRARYSRLEDAVGQRIPTSADGGVLSAVVLSIPGGQHVAERKRKRWVRSVTTDSTHPPPGLFKKKAATIARVLASKRVSPKGPQSGMRMLTYFINRGGRGLSKSRRAELERAKRLLSKRVRQTRANSRRSK
jgi:Protein of unknown function (DUF3175)